MQSIKLELPPFFLALRSIKLSYLPFFLFCAIALQSIKLELLPFLKKKLCDYIAIY